MNDHERALVAILILVASLVQTVLGLAAVGAIGWIPPKRGGGSP